MEKTASVFATLNAINCNDKTEQKNGLTYLAWAFAWGEVKKNYPSAFYTIYENADGWNYHTDGRTCWVKTGVTIEGLEHIEYLPVMDTRNRSIPVDAVTSFDVNKAIQRSLTKACARHGLGLYIYAGEDLPDAADDETRAEVKTAPVQYGAMTKEQFRKRWDGDKNGGGITYDDIADCAKAWGLFSKPRTCDINKVKVAVLQAAGCISGYPKETAAPAPAAAHPDTLTDDQYWSIVRAYAQGRKTSTGGDYRATWIINYNPTDEQVAKFDNDVENFLAARGGNPNLNL